MELKYHRKLIQTSCLAVVWVTEVEKPSRLFERLDFRGICSHSIDHNSVL